MITELKGIHAITLEEVKRETEKDELLQKIIHAVKSNGTLKKDLDMDVYANVISELSVINCLLLRGERFVMPEKLQKKVVDAAHEGHQGITKTLSSRNNTDLTNATQDDATSRRNHGKSCCRFLWAVAQSRIVTVSYL